MSTLLTAVLTHHLAWVPTVMPAGGTPSPTYRDKHNAKWVDTLAKSHPYNPLWAQLGYVFCVFVYFVVIVKNYVSPMKWGDILFLAPLSVRPGIPMGTCWVPKYLTNVHL